MKIVLCATKNWYFYVYVLIYSILKNNDVDKFYIIIEDEEIPSLKAIFKNIEIEFVNVNNFEFIKETSPNYDTKYSKLSLCRLYLSKILKEDKILYLDVDTIVNDNLKELWNIELLEDNVIAGVHEYGEWDKHLYTKGLDDKYINSGVLLMNLKKIREAELDESMLYLANNNKYEFPDQDIINLVCRDRIVYLDNKFNHAETTGKCDNPIITHYIRGNKGWVLKDSLWYKYRNEFIEGGEYNMKYLVKFNPSYKNGYFDDTTVYENDKMVRRDKTSEAWIVDEDRKDFLLSHGAIIVVEEIAEKKSIEDVKIPKEIKKKTTKKK